MDDAVQPEPRKDRCSCSVPHLMEQRLGRTRELESTCHTRHIRANNARDFRPKSPMKLKWLALFALVTARHLSAQSSSPPSPPSAPTIRVAFWNIQWFPGRHPNASPIAEQRQITAVQRDMRMIDADVIGIEEARDFSKAAIAVASRPGFKVDVCSNFPPREDQNVAQQVAIASRLTPISAWVELWKRNGALLPPRGFAFAVYQIAPGRLLFVYAVHLKSNRGEISEDIAIREESMRQLNAHMEAMNRAYGRLGLITWMVGGDFNTSLDDSRFQTETTARGLIGTGFSWCWQNVPQSERVTLPPDKFFPSACFDHIFFRNARLMSARVVSTSRQSSDHRAIVAAFELAP
jgi:endonuclease/exonuclease/phosphatase (EEP) superfamily protein YafD